METAKCVKKNLPRHNKRFHPELNHLKDQAWMLAWRLSGSSAIGAYGLGSFFQPEPKVPVPVPAAELARGHNLNPEVATENVIENLGNDKVGLDISDEEKRSCGKRKRGQLSTISQAFGVIPSLYRSLQRINQDIDQVQIRCDLSEAEKADGLLVVKKLHESLQNLEKLKKEFDRLTDTKRLKLKQAELIAEGFVKAQDEMEGLKHALKLEQEKNKDLERPGSKSRVISEKKLSEVAINFQTLVKKCLLRYATLVLVNGMLECSCCRDDWKIAGLSKQPPYTFKPNARVDGSVKRHFEQSANHLRCSRAREVFNNREDFYQRARLRFKSEANII